MKFLVIGCGSIGLRHIKNLISLEISPEDIVLCDIDETRLNKLKNELGIKESFTELSEVKNNYPKDFFNGILITNPTSLHIHAFSEMMEYGKYFFIEKPISHDLENIEILMNNKDRIMTAYNLRFEKGINLVKDLLESGRIGQIYSCIIEYGSYLPNWHPESDYTKEYSARRDLGGGIVLDDIHEIDLALYFFGKPKHSSGYCAKISNLKIDTEDVAEIFIEFENNVYCNIHMDYLQHDPVRRGKIIGEKGTIEWDIFGCNVRVFDADKNKWEITNYVSEWNDLFVEELKYFMNCIKTNSEIGPNAEIGIQSLKIAVQVLKDNKIL